jgi:hypothetical protein
VAAYEATHPDERICLGRDGTGVTGYLGLKEWIASALYPVGPDSVHDLQAGYHPSPVNVVKQNSAPGAAKGGAATASVKKLPYSLAIDRLKKASDAAQTANSAASASAGRIESLIPQIRRAIASTIAVLEPHVKQQILNNITTLGVFAKDARSAAAIAKSDTDQVKKVYDDNYIAAPSATDTILEQSVIEAEATKDNAVEQQQYVSGLETDANKIVGGLNHIDPPIDSLLHSVDFVLTYGASISPNWTLLQFKGPSPTGASTGSAGGQRTHVLNIALGPVGNQEQNRLIQNQSVTSPH